jgi:antitoxin ParD1/3/4
LSAGPHLKAPREQASALDNWLMAKVAPVYDAMKADPSRGIPADEVFAALRARHAQRIKDRS